MTFEIHSVADLAPNLDAVGVGFFSDMEAVPGSGIDFNVEGLKAVGFEGEVGQVQTVLPQGRVVVAIGLGDRAEVKADTLRRAAAQFIKSTGKYERVGLVLGDAAQAIAEGLVLGAYKFTTYKSKVDERVTTEVSVLGADSNALGVGEAIAKAQCVARDLINEPASAMTPTRFAERAEQLARTGNVQIEVWDEARIEAENLGGLVGVAKGSDQPPRLVKLSYNPDGASRSIALVGKGITFDSGGLSLKSGDGMMTMKTDMSGAAAVVAAMSVLPVIAPNVRIVGFACLTENLPGPSATKPGDVLKARNGKTMEVLNTDAEGRLVLADGLSLAVEENVDAIIDVATLTGACKVALGGDIAGLFGNNDDFSDKVKSAATRADELLWELPLHKGYRKAIDSDIADMKNIGSGGAGATTAALFLQEFVNETPWVHLDIAGPARADSDDAYTTKGGTGFAVRTLVELVRTF